MPFEYDPAKSATNKAKHGISFDEAQELWKDARMLEAPARTDDEPRFLVIGKIGENHWVAVCAHVGTMCGSSRCGAPGNRRSITMKASEFDRKFDAGEDVSGHVDWSKAKRPNEQIKRVNVDFPSMGCGRAGPSGATPWRDPPGAHQVMDR